MRKVALPDFVSAEGEKERSAPTKGIDSRIELFNIK
jgi:hypothetical protein